MVMQQSNGRAVSTPGTSSSWMGLSHTRLKEKQPQLTALRNLTMHCLGNVLKQREGIKMNFRKERRSVPRKAFRSHVCTGDWSGFELGGGNTRILTVLF